jgi:hypothetical protein
MTEKTKKEADELSAEELEEQDGEELPDREAMSVIQVPTIAPEPGLDPPPPLPENVD